MAIDAILRGAVGSYEGSGWQKFVKTTETLGGITMLVIGILAATQVMGVEQIGIYGLLIAGTAEVAPFVRDGLTTLIAKVKNSGRQQDWGEPPVLSSSYREYEQISNNS